MCSSNDSLSSMLIPNNLTLLNLCMATPCISISSNVQVLQQLVTALNRSSSDVMRVVHDRRPFPTDTMQQVVPTYRVRRAAHYMIAMGLWRPPTTPEIRGPLPLATCNACMSCSDCFPYVRQ